MLLVTDIPESTFNLKVLVQFPTAAGGVKQGEFTGVFKRQTQQQIDKMIDDEWLHSDVVEEVLVGVQGIGRTPSEELPSDEALTWVKQQPECVSAAATAFFKTTRPERYNEKTSGKRRGRG